MCAFYRDATALAVEVKQLKWIIGSGGVIIQNIVKYAHKLGVLTFTFVRYYMDLDPEILKFIC